ncbi:ankyrin repeat domain-containing protein, partial [Bacteriovoracales bacterium]|nr:ankyrin repeat domain-containing protein [Bacteriovoracales bacterium]
MLKKIVNFLFFLISYPLFADNFNVELSKASDPSNFNQKKIKELIIKGADVNFKNKWGSTPLMMAVINKKLELVKFLIERGADPNLKNKKGFSSIDFAKKLKNKEFLKTLRRQGPSNSRKKTKKAIKFSKVKSKIDFGKWKKSKKRVLKKEVSEVGKTPPVQRPLLKDFLDRDNFNVMKIKEAIKGGADIETLSDEGETALFWAIRKKKLGLTEWLVKRDATMTKKNNKGETVKDLATKARWFKLKKWVSFYLKLRFLKYTTADNFDPEKIKALVEMKIPLDELNKDGETSLTAALRVKNREIFDFLLDKWADPSVKNSKGKSALDIVQEGALSDLLPKVKQMALNAELR